MRRLAYLSAILCPFIVPSYAASTSDTDVDGSPSLARTEHTVWDAPRTVDPKPFNRPTLRGAVSFLSLNAEPEADLPLDVAFLPDGSAAAIVHWVTDNVTFFDVNSRTVTHTVAVGDFPVHVAVSPDGLYTVVPNVSGNSVSIIENATHTELAEVPVTGLQPYRVAISSDSAFAVVGVINDAINSSFSVIDLATRTEVRSFPSASQGAIGGFGDTESGITGPLFTKFAITPSGTKIVLPNRSGTDVRVYDWSTGTQLAAIPTAGLPTAVDISADSTTAVVSHEGANQRISKIDLATLTRTGDFATTQQLSEQVIRITPDKSHAIAAISNNVIFVNLTSGATTATLATGSVGDIEISHNGQFAFVSNFNARVINIATQTIVATMSLAACVESAVSPVSLRAVALNSRFREDIQVYNINGASSFVEGLASTGQPPEADATRVLAISPDGHTVIANNNVSRNVSFIDLPTRTVLGHVDTGDRPQGVAITPDGQTALVANTDANGAQGTVSVLDVATRTVLTTLNITVRPVHIRISPDGQTAYILTVAGTDMIHFVHIAGAASSVIGTQLAGQTGSAFGYTFTEISGIELSPDGSLLAVCVSFDDQVRFIDTATRAIVANVAVGDFPIRVAFSPSGNRAYVSNAFSNNVSVINVAGAGSSVIATVPTVGRPLTLNPDAAAQFVYIGTVGTGSGGGGVRVLDAATNTIVRTIAFAGQDGPRDAYLSNADGTLYVVSSEGQFVKISAAGAASAIVEQLAMTSTPSDMVFSESQHLAVAALPIPDGVDLLGETPPCVGDVDGSGGVDLADLTLLLSQFGSFGPGLSADLDADGDVDLADLTLLLSNFGSDCV
jgi:YVTN family beta-propeller protein